MSVKILQSYVAEAFFVSTIYRRASTMEESYYYETITWTWSPKTKKRGAQVNHCNTSSLSQAMRDHYKVIMELLEDFNPIFEIDNVDRSVGGIDHDRSF